MSMKTFVTAEPFHPGEYIADELEARSWTQADLAAITGLSRRHIINLIQGKAGLTPDVAGKVAAAFGEGHTAQGWMNLQVAFELASVAQHDRDTKKLGELYSAYPVAELCRRHWINKTDVAADLEQQILKLVSPHGQELQVAARKSTTYTQDSGAQRAWYGRAYQMAEGVSAARFDGASIDAGIGELMSLAGYPEDARRVPRVLADMGIRLVVLQHLKHTKIDGAALWLDGQSPVVALSLRYDRMDYFWFTLLHELMHIKHNHKSAPIDTDALGEQVEGELPEIERVANRDAACRLIDDQDIVGFINRNKPRFSEAKINRFAATHNIHPAIVVGQLHARKRQSGVEYTHFRGLLVKVRQFVLESAAADGWNSPVEE